MGFYRAQTAADALRALLLENGNALVIAGGSDVMVELREGKRPPRLFVDVTSAADMRGIAVTGGELTIGAAVTLTEIARSPLVGRYFPSLCKAAGAVGSLQIRNVATLVGNVVTAQPAADAAMALAPLAPQFVVLSASGERRQPMGELYADIGKSVIDSSREVVKEARIPLPGPGEAASFIRLELRKSLSLPMLNAAAMLRLADDRVEWARVTMGPVGIGPTRARASEAFLAGKALSKENAVRAGELALEDAELRGNPLRGSREYREMALPVLVRRALEDIGAQLGCPFGEVE